MNHVSCIQKKAAVVLVVFCGYFLFLLTPLTAQTYDPKTGNTHYPNGTIYISTSPHTGGPVVTGPEREDGSWERVECDKNEASNKRCGEILEEATPDEGTNPGEGGSDSAPAGETNTQSLSPSEAEESSEYFHKQVKARYGVWTKQNGKWYYIENPRAWTKKIIQSWKRKK